MNGPTSKPQIPDSINLNEITVKDLLTLKSFIEKARRSNLFTCEEEAVVNIIHMKLTKVAQLTIDNHNKHNKSK